MISSNPPVIKGTTKMKKLIITLITTFYVGLLSISAYAVELKAQHPEFHVVKEGDTLWDISGMFLRDPWLWPEIWHVNEQIDNPHLIYPGDVLALVYIDGQPRIIKRRSGKGGLVKLSPQIREVSRGSAITTLPLDVIQPFLVGARVVTDEQFKKSPYVIAGEEGRLINASGHKVYIRGVIDEAETKFTFFRRGEEYIDPDTGESLGIEAIHLATGVKIRNGDPATIRIKTSVSEVLKGDKAWFSQEDQLKPYYFPHAPDKDIDASIISVYNGVVQIGQYDVVVLNRGEREGLEVGHVLSVFQRGGEVVDEFAKENNNVKKQKGFKGFMNRLTGKKQKVTLPDEEAGKLMIFRTFEKVSLGLVLEARRPLHILDKAKTPY